MPIDFPPNMSASTTTQVFIAAPRVGDMLRPALSSAYRCTNSPSDDIDRLMQQLDSVPSVQSNAATSLTSDVPD
jgi:hypothetical protein